MNKNIIITVVLLAVLVGGGVYLVGKNGIKRANDDKEASPTENLIGGQKDEHGCLIPAGYSWCEVKQKCLRTWEEPCEEQTNNYADWLTYRSEVNGFEIKLPKTWEGYQASETTFPDYSLTGFSFKDGHQPFSIFQIVVRTKEQWDKVINKTAVKVLSETGDRVYVCDGCCGLNTDYSGGGQFDEFQSARCQEGAEIVKTFKLAE